MGTKTDRNQHTMGTLGESETGEAWDWRLADSQSRNLLLAVTMWARIHHCDEERQLVFGTLDNEPVVNAEDLRLGEELAISYGKVREHQKPWEFQRN